jgi:hypothetical protein
MVIVRYVGLMSSSLDSIRADIGILRIGLVLGGRQALKNAPNNQGYGHYMNSKSDCNQ